MSHNEASRCLLGDTEGEVQVSNDAFDVRPSLRDKLIKNHLPLGFLFVLAVALIFPTPGEKVKDWQVRRQTPRLIL